MDPTPNEVDPAHADQHRWCRLNTAAHHAAQHACRHVIACAVDGDTRQAVIRDIEYARAVGDAGALPLLITRLTGPCALPPADTDAPCAAPPDSDTGASS